MLNFSYMLGKYLDPKNDLAFKKIFGSEKHKNIPIDFLNAVLQLNGDNRVVELTFLDLQQSAKIASRKESSVDVLVRDQMGRYFIVEMQVAKVKGFEKRAQYYAAKTYCSHFKVGGQYFNLNKIIFLAITNYTVFPEKKDYTSTHVTLDNKTFENDLKDFSYTFVELPKFTKQLNELTTLEDKWIFFLKHANESREITQTLSEHLEIKEAYDVIESYNWSEQDLFWYEKEIMRVADEGGRLAAIEDDLIEKGWKRGLKEGFEQGQEDGHKKGSQQTLTSIVQRLMDQKLSMAEISKYTGLSEQEISKL